MVVVVVDMMDSLEGKGGVIVMGVHELLIK